MLITRRGGEGEGRGTYAINTRLSIKTCPCKSIFGRAIFFFLLLPSVPARFRPRGRFFRCADNEDNNEITLRSITRRYPRRLPIRARIGFSTSPPPLPCSISNISEREFVSDANPDKVICDKDTRGADAWLACPHGARGGKKSVSSEIPQRSRSFAISAPDLYSVQTAF